MAQVIAMKDEFRWCKFKFVRTYFFISQFVQFDLMAKKKKGKFMDGYH